MQFHEAKIKFSSKSLIGPLKLAITIELCKLSGILTSCVQNNVELVYCYNWIINKIIVFISCKIVVIIKVSN